MCGVNGVTLDEFGPKVVGRVVGRVVEDVVRKVVVGVRSGGVDNVAVDVVAVVKE